MSRSWWWHDSEYCPGPSEYEEDVPGPTNFLHLGSTGKGKVIGITMSRYIERDPWALVHVFEFTRSDMLARDIPQHGDRLELAGLYFGTVTQVHYTNDAMAGTECWDVTAKMGQHEAEELERQMFPLLTHAPLSPRPIPAGQPVYASDCKTIIGYTTEGSTTTDEHVTVMTSGFVMGPDGKIHPVPGKATHTVFPLGGYK